MSHSRTLSPRGCAFFRLRPSGTAGYLKNGEQHKSESAGVLVMPYSNKTARMTTQTSSEGKIHQPDGIGLRWLYRIGNPFCV
jgi:hypothetical protein